MIRILKILPLALLLCWSVAAIGQEDCQPLLTLLDDISTNEFYQAEEINSSANITAGTVVTFQAENNILLTDGFQTSNVAQFHGYIADCNIVNNAEDLAVLQHSIKLFLIPQIP